MQWTIDLVGPMPSTLAKEMMIVVTDYFTKCIEAKYDIKQHIFTPRYLQGNNQAEISNKFMIDCLKKRLESAKGK